VTALHAHDPSTGPIRVSVVVPTRNRSALLAMTLRSVRQQQDVDLEVIVVDEASSDDTPAVLAALDDSRVHVIRHQTAQGLPAARNRGAAVARGEWLAFIDDDDLWAPDKLLRQVQAAQAAACDWVYTGAVNIDRGRIVASRRPPPPDEVVAALPRFNPIPGGGSNVIVRRPAWLRVGPFEPRCRSGAEDWEMSIRLAKDGLPAWVCSPLIAKRVHPSNMSLDVGEIVRATKLVEVLHGTKADWGRVHRWLAERHLRSGRRLTALAHLVRAATMGQAAGVAWDCRAIVHRRLARLFPKGTHGRAHPADAWAAAAAAWLREFEPCV
jgi:glycosyltransferase involved in cell wall biosynthesis